MTITKAMDLKQRMNAPPRSRPAGASQVMPANPTPPVSSVIPAFSSPLNQPELAGHLVPLLDWVSLDFLDSGQIGNNLDLLLQTLAHATQETINTVKDETALAEARELHHMLLLGKDILREAYQKIAVRLTAVYQYNQTRKGQATTATPPFEAKNRWQQFSIELAHMTPHVLLTNIALLGVVCCGPGQSDDLLMWTASRFEEPWRIHGRLMLAVGNEGDIQMAELILSKRIVAMVSEGESKKLKEAVRQLEEIQQIRQRLVDATLQGD